ncbi:hypothetical protein [Tateyamaria sp. SN6-1]|uniref:hypothetical protein n=1 Tax=Tateyamaria sp. SN6-1 TaxID=3092148 RepID=UPI0039F4750A
MKENKEDILTALNEGAEASDNFLAMACVGAAFCQISVFENLVGALVLTSKANLKSKLRMSDLDAAELFREKHSLVSKSTLGQLVRVMEDNGLVGRDLDYLKAIVELRNSFMHRFMDQVPLPGDWQRYGYTLEEFSRYTRHIIRHVAFAENQFSKIMIRHGLLAGNFGDFGDLLWNPESEYANLITSQLTKN